MTALAKLSFLEHSYDQARQEFEHIVGHLDSKEASGMTHSDLERELEKKGRELMRQLLQEHLNNRGPGKCDQPVCDAEGVERSRVRLQERELETIFGTVSIERAGYGRQGTESLHPMDAELNLPDERYSLEMRRRVAEEAAKNSFDETLESIGKKSAARRGPRRRIGIGHQRRWQGCDDAKSGLAGANPESCRGTRAQNGHAVVQGGKEKFQAYGHRGGCLYDCAVCANTRGAD